MSACRMDDTGNFFIDSNLQDIQRGCKQLYQVVQAREGGGAKYAARWCTRWQAILLVGYGTWW